MGMTGLVESGLHRKNPIRMADPELTYDRSAYGLSVFYSMAYRLHEVEGEKT